MTDGKDMTPASLAAARGQTVRADHCLACGASGPGLAQRAVVRGTRWAGVKVPGSSVTLCRACRELLREGRLHFRWVESDVAASWAPGATYVTPRGGHWECLRSRARIGLREANEVATGWRRCA